MGSKVFLTVNGCARRMLDTSYLRSLFDAGGLRIAKLPRRADYIVFVTCGVTKGRIDECLTMIDKLKHYRGELIVAGCLPEIIPEELKMHFQGKTVATKDLNDICDLIVELKRVKGSVPDANVMPPLTYFLRKFMMTFKATKGFFKWCRFWIQSKNLLDVFTPRRSKMAWLRISRGCVANCSYCGIRRAVGDLKSKPLELCQEEYGRMLAQGYRNFTILADNVGAYGVDIGSNFGLLLNALSRVDGNGGVLWSIDELDPVWAVRFKETLLEFMRGMKIRELLCPIQSGSERILKLMNRYSDRQRVVSCLREFMAVCPALKLDTHILVGFPTETEDEFRETLEVMSEVPFNMVTVNPYYDAPGSISSAMAGKHDRSTIMDRVKRVIMLLESHEIKWMCYEL